MKFTIDSSLDLRSLFIIEDYLQEGNHNINYIFSADLLNVKKALGFNTVARYFNLDACVVRMDYEDRYFAFIFNVGWGKYSKLSISEEKALELLTTPAVSDILSYDILENNAFVEVDDKGIMSLSYYVDTIMHLEDKTKLLSMIAIDNYRTVLNSLGWSNETLVKKYTTA